MKEPCWRAVKLRIAHMIVLKKINVSVIFTCKSMKKCFAFFKIASCLNKTIRNVMPSFCNYVFKNLATKARKRLEK